MLYPPTLEPSVGPDHERSISDGEIAEAVRSVAEAAVVVEDVAIDSKDDRDGVELAEEEGNTIID